MQKFSFTYKFALVIVLFVVMFAVSIMFGAKDVSVYDVWASIFSTKTNEDILVIREIRLPREVAAIFVGAALAVSGAIMQGLTRNPLADPGLLGLTAGSSAALAVVLALFPKADTFMIMIACFIGAAIGAGMVFGIASLKKGGFAPFRIVLAGAAVSAFLFAIGQFVGIYYQVSQDISQWTAGGLVGASWSQLRVIAPVIIIAILVACLLSKQLTLLSLNEEVAVGLGQQTTLVKGILFVVVVLLAGAAVALAGNIAFVGLMIPHIVRAIVGTDYRYIIPISAFIGATFLLFADTVARTLNAPYETPLVAVVSVLGLPIFLLIVNRGGKTYT